MEVDEVIAFIFGGLVMVWAFRSAAFAFGGGESSGLHEVAPPSEEKAPPTSEELRARDQRSHRRNQFALYVAGLVVSGALVAMLIGALVA